MVEPRDLNGDGGVRMVEELAVIITYTLNLERRVIKAAATTSRVPHYLHLSVFPFLVLVSRSCLAALPSNR